MLNEPIEIVMDTFLFVIKNSLPLQIKTEEKSYLLGFISIVFAFYSSFLQRLAVKTKKIIQHRFLFFQLYHFGCIFHPVSGDKLTQDFG